jgi:hypothetical protein
MIPYDDQLTNSPAEMPMFTSVLQVLNRTANGLPSWWSHDRDKYLRDTAIKIDFLESAVNTIVLKLFSIPFSVVSKNNSSLLMQKYAEQYQLLTNDLLLRNQTLEKFIRSFLISDNGAFLYVDDGVTPNNEPLQSLPTDLRWLDPTRCQRTGNIEYPVIYWHSDSNRQFPLHNSRVISLVQSPSTDATMHNVGLCFVSRAIMLAQHLSDIYIYEGEVMGSRSSEEIIYATGAKSKEIDEAFQIADMDSNNSGLTRVGKRVYLGLRDPNAKLGKLALKNLPDRYDKRNDIEITLTLLAMASGGSPNWFFDSVKSGSTKASASESTKMGESKIETWFIRHLTHEIEQKVLPDFLKMINRNADIDSTGVRARIQLNLAQKSKLNIESGVTNKRVERQRMLEREEIDLITFEDLELADGRTPNGLPIYSFFETDNEYLRDLLYFTDNPLDFVNNDAEEMIDLSENYLKQAQNLALNSLNPEEQRLGVYAMYTLDYVRDEYRQQITREEIELNEPVKALVEENINEQLDGETTGEVLNGMNDDDELNNSEDPTETALRKAITVDQKVFSTRELRNTQNKVRSLCREYWNNNINQQTFYERMYLLFDDKPNYDKQMIANHTKTLNDFIKSHPRNNKGKLQNIYKLADQFIMYRI